MVACVCNNINEEKILGLAQDGQHSLKDVINELDMKITCARCIPTIKNLLETNPYDEAPD